MKNFAICLFFALLAAATAKAEYVRKTVRPGFFIPSKELNRVEKLPPFPPRPVIAEAEEEQPGEEDINYVIPAQMPSPAANAAVSRHQVIDNHTPPEKVHVNFLQVKTMDGEVDKQKVLPTQPDNKFDDGLEQTPAYRKIRQDYAEDLKTIAQTGQAPDNPAVNAALQKMNSNDSIWVDDTFGTIAEQSPKNDGQGSENDEQSPENDRQGSE